VLARANLRGAIEAPAHQAINHSGFSSHECIDRFSRCMIACMPPVHAAMHAKGETLRETNLTVLMKRESP
jgi:hypothetical protein